MNKLFKNSYGVVYGKVDKAFVIGGTVIIPIGGVVMMVYGYRSDIEGFLSFAVIMFAGFVMMLLGIGSAMQGSVPFWLKVV